MSTDARPRHLLDAVVAVAADLGLDAVLHTIMETAVQLAGARYGALGVPVRVRGEVYGNLHLTEKEGQPEFTRTTRTSSWRSPRRPAEHGGGSHGGRSRGRAGLVPATYPGSVAGASGGRAAGPVLQGPTSPPLRRPAAPP